MCTIASGDTFLVTRFSYLKNILPPNLGFSPNFLALFSQCMQKKVCCGYRNSDEINRFLVWWKFRQQTSVKILQKQKKQKTRENKVNTSHDGRRNCKLTETLQNPNFTIKFSNCPYEKNGQMSFFLSASISFFTHPGHLPKSKKGIWHFFGPQL